MKYEFEWQYADDPIPTDESEPYIHFVFMLRFPDVPLGRGHVAHICFNVLQKPENPEPGISIVRRGFINCVPYSKQKVQKFVEAEVSKAFNESTRDAALEILNEKFINSDVDFSDEFASDVLEADVLLKLIEDAFDGVTRGDAITLHQATVIDDYGSEDEFLAAAKFDTEVRWQDVPDSAIVENPAPFHFLDNAGFRYYLPAFMSWAIRNGAEDYNGPGFFTYLSVFPTVAPREMGRRLGESFDLQKFINERSLTHEQVNAIYRFICFMALRKELEMDEDQYAVARKWRQAAMS
jgi:hypothetical protein